MKIPHVGVPVTHYESICLVKSHRMDNENVPPVPPCENMHTHMGQTFRASAGKANLP